MMGERSKRRWQQLVAKEAREGVLSLPDERELVRLEATHGERTEERVIWEQLGSLGRQKFAGEASDNDIILAALDRFPESLPTPRLMDASFSEANASPSANGRHRFRALIAVVALTVGASAMAALSSSWSNGSGESTQEPRPSIALAPVAVDDVSAPDPDAIIIAAADLAVAESAEAGSLAAGCTRIRPSTEVCVDGDATITSLQPLRVRLDVGRVSVRSSSPITVESPLGPIVTEAADFDLEVAPLPSTTNLSVTAGAVSVWREERLEEVEAGQTLQLRKQLRKRGLVPERRRSPQQALLLAQKLVQRGQIAEAIFQYEAILNHHPRSVEARTARVTLGRLELGRNRPGSALEHFEAYLRGRGGGALHEEARYGRIRALRALGRVREERQAIAKFLHEHPQSIYASRLAERQATFSATP